MSECVCVCVCLCVCVYTHEELKHDTIFPKTCIGDVQ